MKKNLFFLLFLGCNSLMLQAQDFLVGPTISYQSQAGNTLKLGGYFVKPIFGDAMGIRLDANTQFAYFRNQFLVIPEGSLTIYPTFNNLILPFVEGELTPYTLTPKIGLSFATILDLGIGYGFDIHTKQDLKPIKGFTFSFGINIPLNAVLY